MNNYKYIVKASEWDQGECMDEDILASFDNPDDAFEFQIPSKYNEWVIDILVEKLEESC